jgi:hypothetical protein
VVTPSCLAAAMSWPANGGTSKKTEGIKLRPAERMNFVKWDKLSAVPTTISMS